LCQISWRLRYSLDAAFYAVFSETPRAARGYMRAADEIEALAEAKSPQPMYRDTRMASHIAVRGRERP
jgi:hypothetical protein